MRWFLVAASLLTSSAFAEPGTHEVLLGATSISYSSFLRSTPDHLALELSYQQPAGTQGPWRLVRIGGGVRATFPDQVTHVPLEAFVTARLGAQWGPWEPMAGPELGVTGLSRLVPALTFPESTVRRYEDATVGPFYLAFGAEPLRFHFGNFSASAFGFHLGASAFPLGTALRIQVEFIRVGFSL